MSRLLSKTAVSSYYSCNLSIMFLELVTSIEFRANDIKSVELKSWELIIKNKKLKILHSK